MVSHTLGEPFKTLGASLRLALGLRRPCPKAGIPGTIPVAG